MQEEGAEAPSILLRELHLVWKVRSTCRNAADKLFTATHQAFREQAEFTGQISQSGGNSDLIEYLSKEVVTNTVLRERLLKGIADDLPMKNDFEIFCDYLRDEADDMGDKGKPNEASDQVAGGHAGGSATQYPTRGRGQFPTQVQARGRGTSYSLQRGGDTAVSANSSKHQQHEGVAAACLRPLG